MAINPTLDKPQPAGADFIGALTEAVREARASQTPLRIEGGGTKAFLGRRAEGELLDVSANRGVVAYEPSELVVTARAGTPVEELDRLLRESGQMLAFEPPRFGADATLGGTLACGLSGPRRPFAGAARDFVLGVKMLSATGEVLSFGGQVMKNVAGYDLSRLMTGAMGTLGVLLEASLKVLPVPAAERSLRFEMTVEEALGSLSRWSGQPLPLSGASYRDGLLHLRLSGMPSGVAAAMNRLGGETFEADDYWEALREHRLAFFTSDAPLWRLSVPPAAPMPELSGEWLLDWAGAQRWLRPAAGVSDSAIRAAAAATGGHATLFRNGDRNGAVFAPLPSGLLALHRRVKASFDPDGLFNRGRLYPEF